MWPSAPAALLKSTVAASGGFSWGWGTWGGESEVEAET